MYLVGGFGEKKQEKKKEEDWQQLAQVPSFKKKKEKSQLASGCSINYNDEAY